MHEWGNQGVHWHLHELCFVVKTSLSVFHNKNTTLHFGVEMDSPFYFFVVPWHDPHFGPHFICALTSCISSMLLLDPSYDPSSTSFVQGGDLICVWWMASFQGNIDDIFIYYTYIQTNELICKGFYFVVVI